MRNGTAVEWRDRVVAAAVLADADADADADACGTHPYHDEGR
ncbi:hypothetical protein [Microbacterium cremeum]|nr:hypothetical protein [Microbacterium cremeum]